MGEGGGGPVSHLIVVTETSQVGEARRRAAMLAAEAGLSETEGGSLAIVVTEIATNLARHAQGGVLTLRRIGTTGAGGVEVLALDKGPGISDLGRAMSDGFSTGGTSGHGLGAIQRMASEFDITSSSAGTALLARVWSVSGARARAAQPMTDGAVCTPIQGETACGDGWLVRHDAHRTLLAVVDGLGHGPEAAKAADTALRVISDHSGQAPAALIQLVHAALRATRGAAIGIATLHRESRSITFAGVGNIAGSIIGAVSTKSMASYNGTVGHTMHKVQEFTYAWAPDASVILHSDGIQTRWRLDTYPGLHARHPALIAGVLHRDFIRGRDDATVLVVRQRPLQPPA